MYRSTCYSLYLTFPISTKNFFKDGRLEASPSTYKCTGPPVTPHTSPSRSQPTTYLRTVVLKYLRPPTSAPVPLVPLIPHLPSRFQPTTSLRTVVLKYLRPPTSVPVHLLPLIPHLPPTSVPVYLLPFTSPSHLNQRLL